MKRLLGIFAVLLIALCFACSTGDISGGDSPVVPMPSPPIARGFPITVDFGEMPDGPVDGPTEVGSVVVDGDNIEVQSGDIIIEGGTLRVLSPRDFQQAAVLVRELDGYSSTSIEGYDAEGNLLTATTTGAPGDYYYARLSASDSIIRKINVLGPNARVRKMILARPFSIIEFQPADELPILWHASVILSADFNSDDIPDVAVGDSYTNRVAVLYGSSGGGFSGPTIMSCDLPAVAMDTGDFDGDADGRADLAVLGEKVNIYLSAPGGISSTESYIIGSDTEDIDVGDVTGDGIPDIAVATRTGVYTLAGAGNGFFNNPQFRFAVDARAIRVADVNGDGDADMVIAAASPNELQVRVNKGGGNFSISGFYALTGTPVQMHVDRFNWDEEPDVAVLMDSTPNWQTYINDGGILHANQLFQATSGHAAAFEMLDVNNDGFADMAVIDPDNNEVSVFTTDLAGNFIIADRWNVNARPLVLEAADLDSDSRNDLIIGEADGNVNVYRNVSR